MWIGAPEEENVTLPQKVSQRRVRRHFLELKFTLWLPVIIRGTNVGWGSQELPGQRHYSDQNPTQEHKREIAYM